MRGVRKQNRRLEVGESNEGNKEEEGRKVKMTGRKGREGEGDQRGRVPLFFGEEVEREKGRETNRSVRLVRLAKDWGRLPKIEL